MHPYSAPNPDPTSHKAIADLEARMDEVEKQREEVAFSTHQYKFSSHGDVKKWIEDNDVESCGIYWDLFGCLVKMGEKKQTGTEQAQGIFAATLG